MIDKYAEWEIRTPVSYWTDAFEATALAGLG
jgi:hypothetical protein